MLDAAEALLLDQAQAEDRAIGHARLAGVVQAHVVGAMFSTDAQPLDLPEPTALASLDRALGRGSAAELPAATPTAAGPAEYVDEDDDVEVIETDIAALARFVDYANKVL